MNYIEIIYKTKPLYWVDYSIYLARKLLNKHPIPKIPSINKIPHMRWDLFDDERFVVIDKETVIRKAEDICNDSYEIFSKKVCKIKGDGWLIDPITGYKWPDEKAYLIRGHTPPGNDIKYPWELSRMQMLVTLAQAYYVTENIRYAYAYKEIINDWIINNPIGNSVNWSCTMEVSIRAINVYISANLLFVKKFNDDLLKQTIESFLYSQMIYIRNNIEYGIVRGNHYLADIVGLLILSKAFANSESLYRYSKRKFMDEIYYQINNDGTDHEASTSYHALVYELFLIGIVLGFTSKNEIPGRALLRLTKMHGFLQDLCEFSEFPYIGDMDSGRIIKLNPNKCDFKELLYLGSFVFDIPLLSNFPEDLKMYANMFIRNKNYHKTNKDADNNELHHYKDGGFIFYRNLWCRLLFRSGTIGLKGKGGHGHNDHLSFYIEVYNDPLFIDPGTYVYTRDPVMRNEFRKTASHNTVSIGDVEQNTISIKYPFRMANETKSTGSINKLQNGIVIKGSHRGYYKKLHEYIHRNLRIDTKSLVVNDRLVGKYRGNVQLNFILDASVTIVNENPENLILQTKSGKFINIIFNNGTIKIDNAYQSRLYGSMYETKKIAVQLYKQNEILEIESRVNIIK